MKKVARLQLAILSISVVAGSLLTSCKATARGHTVHESFTPEAIASGDLAVGGVTSAVTAMSEPERSVLAERFRRIVVDEHEDYRVVSAGNVAIRMGDEDYAAMIDEFEKRGELNEGRLEGIADALSGTRYLMMLRVEKDGVTRDRWERDNDESDALGAIEATSYGGAPQSGDTIFARKTTRRVRVGLIVYDLTTRAQVWSGSVTGSRVNTNKRKDDAQVGLMAWIFDTDQYPERPEPPTFDKVVGVAFRGLAENLPEQ